MAVVFVGGSDTLDADFSVDDIEALVLIAEVQGLHGRGELDEILHFEVVVVYLPEVLLRHAGVEGTKVDEGAGFLTWNLPSLRDRVCICDGRGTSGW